MTTFSDPGSRVIDIGTPDWCWTQLATVSEGLLTYRSPRGRLSLVVPYTVAEDQIMIPMAPFNEPGWLAAGGEVTLEVMGAHDADLRWVVRASTVAVRMPTATRTGGTLRPWHPSDGFRPGSEQLDGLLLPAPRVRGFYQTSIHSSRGGEVRR